jgi:hypothetical protein
MKTITLNELLAYDAAREYETAVEMNVPMGELKLLDAALLEHGLELHVAISDYAKFVKVVKI